MIFALARQFEQRVDIRNSARNLVRVRTASSSRLRCCISFWLFSELFQNSGSEISASVSANFLRLLGASKIAPHSIGLLPERNVLSF